MPAPWCTASQLVADRPRLRLLGNETPRAVAAIVHVGRVVGASHLDHEQPHARALDQLPEDAPALTAKRRTRPLRPRARSSRRQPMLLASGVDMDLRIVATTGSIVTVNSGGSAAITPCRADND